MPFQNERDGLGHIRGTMLTIAECENSSITNAKHLVQRKFYQLDQRKKVRAFQLNDLGVAFDRGDSPLQRGFSRLHLEQKKIKQIKKLMPKHVSKSRNEEIAPFYDRNNYQKFYHRRSPSVVFPKLREHKSLHELPDASAVKQEVLRPRKKARRQKIKLSLGIFFEEEQRRRELESRLKSRVYPGVSEELQRMDQQFISLKNNLLHLKNETIALKLTKDLPA